MTTLTHPFDEEDARAAERLASSLQAGGEQALRDAFAAAADAERSYRRSLAEAIVRYKATGVAWTVCGDLARGDALVADLRYSRDVAEGVKEAAVQAAWRLSADRRALGRLVDWSARRDLSHGAEPEQPAWTPEVAA